MGTRSLTVFLDAEDGGAPRELAVLYRQFDGYPSGHGRELARTLVTVLGNGQVRPRPLVNGLGQNKLEVFNGMEDLAVQVIAELKAEQQRWDTTKRAMRKAGVRQPGNFYLMPAGTRDAGEEYIYFVSSPERGRVGVEDPQCEPQVRVTTSDPDEELFSGPATAFYKWTKKQKL